MKKFTISQLADLFKISRQTLIYYDKIDLLKPEYIDYENKYRYYTYRQVLELSFILFLKQAEFSLKDIKEYIKCKNEKETFEFLVKKEIELDKKIKILKKAQNNIKEKINVLKELSIKKEEEVIIEMSQEKYIIELDTKKIADRYEMEAAFLTMDEEAEKYGLDNYEVSVTISLEDIKKSNFFEYKNPAFTVPKDTKGAKLIESTLSASIIHRLSFNKINLSYEKLLTYIYDKGFEPCGDSREFSEKNVVYTGEGVASISKISIPVRKIKH